MRRRAVLRLLRLEGITQMSMNVYTMQVDASHLDPGDIVVVGGNARYLTRPEPAMRGELAWAYETRNPDGSVAATGVMNVRADSQVTVVCVDLDGHVVTP